MTNVVSFYIYGKKVNFLCLSPNYIVNCIVRQTNDHYISRSLINNQSNCMLNYCPSEEYSVEILLRGLL